MTSSGVKTVGAGTVEVTGIGKGGALAVVAIRAVVTVGSRRVRVAAVRT